MTPVDHTQHGANRFFNYYDTPITFFLLSPTRGGFSIPYDSEGRVRVPKRMNFWKGSKRPLTPTALPLRMVPISGNHVHAFHTIWPSYLLAYIRPY